MPLVEETIEMSIDPSKLFPIITDFEKYPEIMEDVKEVNILERGDGWTVSEWINEVDGRVIRWIEKDFIKPAENRIDFEQIEGDLKIMKGFWQLENHGSVTKVIFSIYFEFGIPMIAPLIHPLLAKKLRENMKQMLTDLKKRAEDKTQVEA
ncbi:MAG: SRPBCC family protein [Firmicutes bacterium]|nr:SRPBCC family protein [Bacillota bacterium]